MVTSATRQILYQDYIIGSVSELAGNLRTAWGNLETPVPFVLAAADVLRAIGLEDSSIRAILGPDLLSIDPTPCQPTICQYCENPAAAMILVRDGYRLACAAHAAEAETAGHEIKNLS